MIIDEDRAGCFCLEHSGSQKNHYRDNKIGRNSPRWYWFDDPRGDFAGLVRTCDMNDTILNFNLLIVI